MRNVADLPLHGGHVPPWLAQRMRKLTRLVLILAVDEYGTKGLLERLSDPVWFQAFNNVIGMDWDSSGSTTVTAGMIKDALWREELGVKAAGGKGKKSRATPEELKTIAKIYDLDPTPYIRTSRLVAKVDTVALQTGYQLYHHVFFLDEEGNWAVIQQGMNETERMARRFHWFDAEVFTLDPHKGIAGLKREFALNTVSKEAREYQKTLLDIIQKKPVKIERELESLKAIAKGYRPLVYYKPRDVDEVSLLRRYESLGRLELNKRALEFARELSVNNYEELLLLKGLGPSTLRALSLVLELVYDVHPSWKDPVTHPPDPFKFTYAVGGKDRVPFPIERKTYDELISFLEKLVEKNPGEKALVRNVTKITKNWKFPEEEKRAT
ncbi:DUF763 domain-containing protein [Thermococcus sp. GR7]|uniref:DUF763 domain-containing protein n=1 Tax=unclassified Thermococcus TaxID=2627626 RepID=UPI0014313AA0|nr:MULTISPECIES: DUF763 domain-containing protein [unclassified Thermococcus]NJE47410.1 DUF763 domain-containing protein [Thermococcus sp. GR7]NJE78905.1 DUF763 domain-containing protein [Thermococcus sp. GR4]NJF23100.1 DUF763 domain-containing protein [Thermococcus sp. GR5]